MDGSARRTDERELALCLGQDLSTSATMVQATCYSPNKSVIIWATLVHVPLCSVFHISTCMERVVVFECGNKGYLVGIRSVSMQKYCRRCSTYPCFMIWEHDGDAAG